MDEKREKRAVDYFREGYNCSQSVVLAFYDKCNIDKQVALNISAPFGGGLGRQREVCGAVSGMCMVAGLLSPFSNDDKHSSRSDSYKLIQNMCNEFKEVHGSIICRDLLSLRKPGASNPEPSERTAEYYATRPCEKCVEDCAIIISKYFAEK